MPFNVFQEHWYGLYIQDQVTVLIGTASLAGNGRYDWAEVGRGQGATFDAVRRRGWSHTERQSIQPGSASSTI
ncbi:MAG: hypothetical protein MRJ92_02820 [Nitrospira sp.]|nr:hypothetical protein [Nitrospira sp.]